MSPAGVVHTVLEPWVSFTRSFLVNFLFTVVSEAPLSSSALMTVTGFASHSDVLKRTNAIGRKSSVFCHLGWRPWIRWAMEKVSVLHDWSMQSSGSLKSWLESIDMLSSSSIASKAKISRVSLLLTGAKNKVVTNLNLICLCFLWELSSFLSYPDLPFRQRLHRKLLPIRRDPILLLLFRPRTLLWDPSCRGPRSWNLSTRHQDRKALRLR